MLCFLIFFRVDESVDNQTSAHSASQSSFLTLKVAFMYTYQFFSIADSNKVDKYQLTHIEILKELHKFRFH